MNTSQYHEDHIPNKPRFKILWFPREVSVYLVAQNSSAADIAIKLNDRHYIIIVQ